MSEAIQSQSGPSSDAGKRTKQRWAIWVGILRQKFSRPEPSMGGVVAEWISYCECSGCVLCQREH
eukprot:84551-Karenia_brevis.AAC.1